MKGVKHVRRWREEALRGELCEPGRVAVLRRRPTGTGSAAGEADLVDPRPDRDRMHGRRGRALGYQAEETLERRLVMSTRSQRSWS